MNGVAQAASVISTLVFFPLLFRAFGAGVYGIYVLAISVMGLALMFDFGIGTATVRAVAAATALNDTRRFATVLATSALLLAALGCVAGVVIAGIGLAAATIFSVTPEEARLLTQLLLIGAIMQVWLWPASVAVHALGGLERYDLAARTSVVSVLGNVAAIAVVLWRTGGPVQLMVMGAGVMVIGTIINLVALWRVTPSRAILPPKISVARQLIESGLPVFAVGFTQFLNKEQADRLIVGMILGPASVALYEIAAKLSALLTQVTNLPVSAVLPLASSLAARHDSVAMRTLFVKGARVVSLIVVPFAAALFVLAGPFVRVWFGDGFETSVVVARMLVAAQVLVPLYLLGDIVLVATNRFGLWVRPGLTLAATNVVLSVALAPRFGLVGVGFGTLVAGVLEFPFYARMVQRELGVAARNWLAEASVAYVLGCVPAIVAYALSLTNLAGSLLGIAVCGLLAVGSYWSVAWVVALTPQDRLWVAQRLKRMTAAVFPRQGRRR